MKNAKYSFNCKTTGTATRHQVLLARYIRNALNHSEHSDKAIYGVVSWLKSEDSRSFTLQIPDDITTKKFEDERETIHHNRHRSQIEYIELHQDEIINDISNKLNAWLTSSVTKQHQASYGEDQVGRNLQYFFERVTFSEIEKNLLEIMIRESRSAELHSFGSGLFRNLGEIDLTICLLLGLSTRELAPLLNENSLLHQMGLFLSEGKHTRGMFNTKRDEEQSLWVLPTFQETIYKEHKNIDSVLEDIFTTLKPSHVQWKDFAHLGYDAKLVKDTVSVAATTALNGVNVLLYGPPGTGKTEFSKCVATELELSLVSIGENEKSGREPSRADRLAEIRLAQTLFEKTDNTLILVDEMDDILSSGSLFGFTSNDNSLLYVHRLLENNVVPMVWTTNNIENIPQSILRRFTLAVKIGIPDQKTRQVLWERMLKDADVTLPEKSIKKLAFEFHAPPGILANAIKTANANNDTEESISRAARGLSSAVYGPKSIRVKPRDSVEYSAELVNTDINVKNLIDGVLASGSATELSLCLYGAQGTGKTAFAHQLAEELGYDILLKRASDLLSPYVGETEKKIAAAFRQAKETETFLLIDEADSMLRTRKEATQSWEVTRVNEMLTWMESHDLPFACTTNLFDILDDATLRRFTLKIEFMPLTERQVKIAFKHYFNHPIPEHTTWIQGLTPGDFAVVRSKSRILNLQNTPQALVDLLVAEAQLKAGSTNRIGF